MENKLKNDKGSQRRELGPPRMKLQSKMKAEKHIWQLGGLELQQFRI